MKACAKAGAGIFLFRKSKFGHGEVIFAMRKSENIFDLPALTRKVFFFGKDLKIPQAYLNKRSIQPYYSGDYDSFMTTTSKVNRKYLIWFLIGLMIALIPWLILA